jgi:membrane protease YdiL (CAAX protease family)
MMKTSPTNGWSLPLGLLLAASFWYVIFRLQPVNFWAEMTASTLLLAGFARWRVGSTLGLGGLRKLRPWLLGIGSAVCLYLVFWLGKSLSSWFFSLSAQEISAIYAYRDQAPPWIILLLLVFVIGPCEEIFWRGFVQSSLSRSLGRAQGLIFASALYGIVHIWGGNLMLLLAALTCGFFWGWLYHRQKELAPVIVSHAVWDALVFVVIPVQ